MEVKNLLVISHNIIDSSNNVGKTVISLLKKWPSDHIRSIYLRNEVRSTMLCEDTYMITDGDVLKSFFKIKPKKCGRRIGVEERAKSMSGNMDAYRFGNKRYPIVSLIRDIIWHRKSWKTATFKEWIQEVKPDLILFVPNDYVLAFELANYVKEETNAPMITFFTDDSFYYKQKTTLIDSFRRKWLRKVGKDIVSKTSGMICASDLMKEEYAKLFSKESIVLGNCVEITPPNSEVGAGKPDTFVLSYIGNLHSNRWVCIIEIGKCLDRISSEIGEKCVLNVYTASDLGTDITAKLDALESICLKGAVPATEVKSIQEQSDGLVHVEAFDHKSKLSTRLSMSTKIFEYMSRRVPVFAYGPSDISSMYFLSSGPFATICSSEKELYDCLKEYVTDSYSRENIKDRAYNYARANFEEDMISSKFIDFANKVIS